MPGDVMAAGRSGPPVRISGFTIARNAVRYGYPLLESLRSLLPLVEELVIAVGRSDDGTLELVRSLDDPRVTIIETVWDDSLRVGGRVLAQQTNLALERCRHPWAFYLQADEVLHEEDHPRIAAALERAAARRADDVDALWFRFLHFEGTYDYVNPLRYFLQCRVVRNDGRVQSVKDAAGFGRRDGAPLRTRWSHARIFHYGWARAPHLMHEKTLAFLRMYVADDALIQSYWGEIPPEALNDVDLAFHWRGSHPATMRELISRATWVVPPHRRPPLDTPLLNPRFYAAWLRKWRILPKTGPRMPAKAEDAGSGTAGGA
jgi:glycosyltransferase involved in cell wall biosynthesis